MSQATEQLVKKFPQTADDGKLAELDREAMRQAAEQLATLGGSAIVDLVEMLADASAASDSQARHALHALATYVGGIQDNQPRGEIVRALLKMLDQEQSDEVKGFLVRQIQVCGGEEAIEGLGSLLTSESLCESAAQALLSIGPTAAPFLRALPLAKSKEARRTLVQSLAVLRQAEAAGALREAARDEDPDMRLVALWGLANLGQADDVELLVQAANADGFERIQATKSCLILAEKLLSAGRKDAAERIYRHLRESRDDSEAYVREAAERGLEAVG